MTDRDNIELPPLPPFVIAPIADEQTVRDYGRKCFMAGLAEAREECVKAERLWKAESIRAERAITTCGGLERAGEILLARAEKAERELAAVLADRARREKPPELVNPKVHSANLQLTARGNVKINPSVVDNVYACATITLCWTDDGRAWIESEKNRKLAAELRRSGLSTPSAADALDGGVR